MRFLSFLFAVATMFGCAMEVDDSVAGRTEALRELSNVERAFVLLLNDYREANGAAPVMADLALNEGAYDYAKLMADTGHFDHTGPDGSTFSARMCDAGYDPACGPSTLVGENIAAGQQSAREVFDAWRMSPGHNANMLDRRYRVIGIGRAQNASSRLRYYWVNTFGGQITSNSVEVSPDDPPVDPPPDDPPVDPPPDDPPVDPPPGGGGSPADRASRGGCAVSGPGAPSTLWLAAVALVLLRRRQRA